MTKVKNTNAKIKFNTKSNNDNTVVTRKQKNYVKTTQFLHSACSIFEIKMSFRKRMCSRQIRFLFGNDHYSSVEIWKSFNFTKYQSKDKWNDIISKFQIFKLEYSLWYRMLRISLKNNWFWTIWLPITTFSDI